MLNFPDLHDLKINMEFWLKIGLSGPVYDRIASLGVLMTGGQNTPPFSRTLTIFAGFHMDFLNGTDTVASYFDKRICHSATAMLNRMDFDGLSACLQNFLPV